MQGENGHGLDGGAEGEGRVKKWRKQYGWLEEEEGRVGQMMREGGIE